MTCEDSPDSGDCQVAVEEGDQLRSMDGIPAASTHEAQTESEMECLPIPVATRSLLLSVVELEFVRHRFWHRIYARSECALEWRSARHNLHRYTTCQRCNRCVGRQGLRQREPHLPQSGVGRFEHYNGDRAVVTQSAESLHRPTAL